MVYLKPVHARLFNLCMPELTDFAQSRRVLNSDPLQLAGGGGGGHGSLAAAAETLRLSELDVKGFADRPLSATPTRELELERFVKCLDVTELLQGRRDGRPDAEAEASATLPLEPGTKWSERELFGKDVMCLSREELEEEWKRERDFLAGGRAQRLPFGPAYFEQSATRTKVASDMIERLGSDLDKSAKRAPAPPPTLRTRTLYCQLKCRTASLQPSAP